MIYRESLSLLLSGMFIGGLILASLWDWKRNLVPDGVWWVELLLALSIRSLQDETSVEGWIWFFIYFFLQEGFMGKQYGRADAHCFVCCSLFMTARGCGIWESIFHMTLTLLFVTCMQLAQDNVNRRLRLRQPIPMIPYITYGFLTYQFLVLL